MVEDDTAADVPLITDIVSKSRSLETASKTTTSKKINLEEFFKLVPA